jgi:hypothetical protein
VQFFLDIIFDERVKYFMVLRALPEANGEPHLGPGGRTSTRPAVYPADGQATGALQLSDHQKVEKPGAQKRSELMVAMLKLCPRGQDNLPFFAFLPALSPQRAETPPV